MSRRPHRGTLPYSLLNQNIVHRVVLDSLKVSIAITIFQQHQLLRYGKRFYARGRRLSILG
jgi:hypothetical protein